MLTHCTQLTQLNSKTQERADTSQTGKKYAQVNNGYYLTKVSSRRSIRKCNNVTREIKGNYIKKMSSKEKRREEPRKEEMFSTDNPFTPKHTLGY